MNMKRFIKDNLVLLIVLGAALLASLTLLVFAVIEHARMYDYFKQVETLRTQIGDLIKQHPAPVEGNIAPIQNEIKLYKDNTGNLSKYFGRLNKPALEAFAKTLGVKLPEFLEKFRAAWESDTSRTALGGRYRFYNRFKMDYPKWDQAREAFRLEYQKVTAEPLNAANIDEVLLAALGVQRNMDNDPQKCMRYMWSMRSRMTELFNEGIKVKREVEVKDKEGKIKKEIKEETHATSVQGDAASFSFDYKTLPTVENIPNIVRSWNVVGDLCRRLAGSGLDSVNTFVVRNIAGERLGNYIIYHYTIGVSGDLPVVRKFLRELNEAAAKENRVYVVRSVFLYSDGEGAQNIFRERAAEAERLRLELEGGGASRDAQAPEMMMPEPGMRRPGRGMGPADMGGEKAAPVKTAAQLKEEQMKLPYHQRRGYGATLFGGTQKCEAVIDLEYIALAAPELN